MNGRPSNIRVLGSSLVADPYTPQFRAYRYGGDQPLSTDKAAANDKRPLCAEENCTRDNLKAHGLCGWHYEKARVARKKQEAAA